MTRLPMILSGAIRVAVFAWSLSLGLTTATAWADSYRVDSGHSSTLFRVKHLNATNFWGRFNNISGRLVLDDPNSSVEVTIKSESIDTANSARDDHLKSPDFFNVRQFPEITYKSTAVKKVDDTTYEVEGTLTLRGTSKPVKLQLVRTGSGRNQRGANVAGFETSFDIKRSEYGMTYGLEGVGDDIKVVVSIETARQ